MNGPKLYLIDGVDQSQALPTTSWVIPHGNDAPLAVCVTCGHPVETRKELCVQGFDEYATGPYRIRAFWPNDEELICLADHATEISKVLLGIATIPVRYVDCNQERRQAWELAIRQPRLAALEATAHVCGATHRSTGPLRLCPECSAIPDDADLDLLEGNLFPDLTGWSGADVFTIRGTFRRLITADGVAKLSKLGFANLRLVELSWAAP